ncbi:hypothetical protein D3C71_2187340 [compost metagenome]
MLNHDAGGLAHGFGQGVEFEVVHLLARHHRYGLRCFLDGKIQARRGAHGAGGVRVGVFGGGTKALG